MRTNDYHKCEIDRCSQVFRGDSEQVDYAHLRHVWLVHEGTARKYRKDGKYFSYATEEFDDLPDWFMKSYYQTNKPIWDARLKAAGYK